MMLDNPFKDFPANLTWEAFKSLSLEEKKKYFTHDGRLYHVLFAEQFDRKFLDRLYVLTNKVRLISKTHEGVTWLGSLLSNYKAMFYFIQPSTRTFLSFYTACHRLGVHASDVRSTQTSSEIKGESFEDTIRTFSSYFDCLVIRDAREDSVERAAFVLAKTRRPIPVINAGSAQYQHPTQSLLDVFTLRRSFHRIGGIEGKTVMIVGDLRRARTVRSLVCLLSLFEGVKIVFSSPKGFGIQNDVRAFLSDKQIDFLETDKFVEHLKEVDAIYMTRLQDEYDKTNSDIKPYPQAQYTLKYEHLSLIKSTTVILHPLPRRSEIEEKVDSDPRAMYWRQVRNGMWTRVALLAYLFKVDNKILDR